MNSRTKILIGLFVVAAVAFAVSLLPPKMHGDEKSLPSFYAATTSESSNVGGVLYPKTLISSQELLELQAGLVRGDASKDFSKVCWTLAASVGHEGICSHTWSPDGNIMMIAHEDFSFDFIDVANKTVKTVFDTMPHSAVFTQSMGMDPTGDLLLACSPLETPRQHETFNCGRPALVTFDPRAINPIKNIVPLPVPKHSLPIITLSANLDTALVS